MEGFVEFLDWVSFVGFILLALVALRQWIRRRDEGTFWFLMTFATLAVVATVGRIVGEPQPGEEQSRAYVAIVLGMLLLFPYFLYRLAGSFTRSNKMLDRVALVLTFGVIVWGALIPEFPGPGEERSGAVQLYILALLVQWTFLSLVLTVRFWRGGLGQPALARKRMRLMGIAAATLSVALIVSGTAAPHREARPVDIVVALLVILSALLFYVGFAPPMWLRVVWRRQAQEELRRAFGVIVTADTVDEVMETLMPHALELVSAKGIVFLDESGEVIGSREFDLAQLNADVVQEQGYALVRVPHAKGEVVIQTSPYTPFFGNDELGLLGALAAMANLAVERIRSAELRLQLEQAKTRRQQALEINDNIVQGLAVAKYSLDLGQIENATRAVDGTLAAARAIISRLVEEIEGISAFQPGMLVRDRAASGYGTPEHQGAREWVADTPDSENGE